MVLNRQTRGPKPSQPDAGRTPPKVTPNGVSTCSNPSLCGKGVKAGQQLLFSMPYATGTQWIAQEMQQLQSNASLGGIKINLQPKPFNQVTALAAGNCEVAGISCNWCDPAEPHAQHQPGGLVLREVSDSPEQRRRHHR